MKISYGITTHDEIKEIKELIARLDQYKRGEDEIVIVDDNSNEEMIAYLDKLKNGGIIRDWYTHSLNKDFAAHKNFLHTKCDGDYIFNLDADENVHINLILNIPGVLELNPNIDLYYLPRVNTISGALTQDHIKKWRWIVDERGWVNWPDWQSRVYKNDPKIKWKNKVHEVIEGFVQSSALPEEEIWCLYHHKHISKQEQQNEFYETI